MDKQTWLGVVRHVLTTFGGFLASKGLLGESEVEVAAGGLVALVGVIWSILEKRSR